jgi:hypothetical protein
MHNYCTPHIIKKKTLITSWSIGATIYSYLKCIVYDKLLKPRQSFWITLYRTARLAVALYKCETRCFSFMEECLRAARRSWKRWAISRVEYTKQAKQTTASLVHKSRRLQWEGLGRGGGNECMKHPYEEFLQNHLFGRPSRRYSNSKRSQLGRYVWRTGEQWY